MRSFWRAERQKAVLLVTPCVDRLGIMRLCVEFQENSGDFSSIYFKNMSSVVDFIETNFDRRYP